jgi:hypothetical protein
LVSIIDDYAFGDLKSFKSQYSKVNGSAEESTFNELKERLKPVCKRTLRRQVLEYIRYTNRIALVEEFYPTADEQKLYDLVTDYLQRESLFALPAGQRKLMTLILRRLLASSTYAISGTLEALAGKLGNMVQSHESTPLDDAFSGNFETFDEVKDEWEEEDGEEKDVLNFTDKDIEDIKSEIDSLKEFEALAKSIRINSKGEKLFTALDRGFQELERLGASRKAIIFTESTRTQEYLREILEGRGYEGKVVMFNGSNNDKKSRQIYQDWIKKHSGTDRVTGSKSADMRAALVDYFKEEATIMIATEAAAEGINLQFCSLVINYDLPWNPQRIEQRIGRCHRYGQKFDVVVVNFLNKANAADVRVYELLEQKFKLFDGVFGASDEVLGSIESGVDFEKRIAQIYQECRTTDQISTAFNELQVELEVNITGSLKQTRQNLLENFDEEVHEKLRINLQESKDYLSKYENWLWVMTQFYLGDDAIFSTENYSFSLKKNPFAGLNIHPGPYRIGKGIEDVNIYRTNHPLAERIIEECKALELPTKGLDFNYTDAPIKISILEPLNGKSGWLKVQQMTVSTFEIEDYILFSGFTDDDIPLDEDQCKRLFSLSGNEFGISQNPDDAVVLKLDDFSRIKADNVLEEVAMRNGTWFDQEMIKLEGWAEDLKVGLERELKDIDAEIKLRKAEAKKMLKLDEKVKAQRYIKEMEMKRSEKRKSLYEAQDEVDQKKEGLISGIEKRMQQNTTSKDLFLIKWKLS